MGIKIILIAFAAAVAAGWPLVFITLLFGQKDGIEADNDENE